MLWTSRARPAQTVTKLLWTSRARLSGIGTALYCSGREALVCGLDCVPSTRWQHLLDELVFSCGKARFFYENMACGGADPCIAGPSTRKKKLFIFVIFFKWCWFGYRCLSCLWKWRQRWRWIEQLLRWWRRQRGSEHRECSRVDPALCGQSSCEASSLSILGHSRQDFHIVIAGWHYGIYSAVSRRWTYIICGRQNQSQSGWKVEMLSSQWSLPPQKMGTSDKGRDVGIPCTPAIAKVLSLHKWRKMWHLQLFYL